MEKKFVIDYDNKVLTLHYLGQVFMFDLSMGDVGDFWYGFALNDKTEIDINFHQEDATSTPHLEIWNVATHENGYCYPSHQVDSIESCEILGNPINYFGEEPTHLPWMNAFELDRQFTKFKIR